MDKTQIQDISKIILSPISSDKKPRVLVHACCAICLGGVIDVLDQNFQIDVFFYNPNIMPECEYELRLDAVKKLLSCYPHIRLIAPTYDQNEFTITVEGLESEPEGGKRCPVCFDLRLSGTASYASANGYDAFMTTLTISPHKNHLLINKIGLATAKAHDTVYFETNLKKQNGFLIATQKSHELDLYRQNYCGCKFD